jgi:hypothetical protein
VRVHRESLWVSFYIKDLEYCCTKWLTRKEVPQYLQYYNILLTATPGPTK